MTDPLKADDDILPVHRGALREWFVAFMTDLGYPPTVEDWYRFVQGVEERSLVKIRSQRSLTDEEYNNFLVEAALRQAAADVGMVLVTIDPEERKH